MVMRIFDTIESADLSDFPRPRALTSGVFDGLHRAHQELLRRVLAEARGNRGVGEEEGEKEDEAVGTAIVLTFSNHPLSVLAPAYAPRKLLSLDRKTVLLEQLGMDVLIQPPFTQEIAAMSPERFVREVFVERYRIDKLVIGFDFRFGSAGEGDGAFLADAGRRYGFEVEVVPSVYHDEWTISSTRIRELIQDGRVRVASEMIGRPHELGGVVVRGYGRGAQIGFPTANIRFDPGYAVPSSGVYAVFAEISGRRYGGMMNIGFSPTFAGAAYRSEVFLFDFEGEELYDRPIRVWFVERLREERKFPGVDALRSRLKVDEKLARAVLMK